MHVHFDESPTVLLVDWELTSAPLMSYPYRVMPDVMSHNAALLLGTIRRRHADGPDILDSSALPTDAAASALRRLEPHHLKSECKTEGDAFADQRLAGKSFSLARPRNH